MSDLRNRIYIGKLHYDVRESDIERFFKDFGSINDINMKNGYAFVDFEDHRDAEDAVYELDGRELLGDRVSVEHCKGGRDRRDDRRGYNGGGGGRDRGGSSRFKNSFSLFERPFNTKHRVVVEGLSSSTDWRDLKDFFRRVAEVTFADAHRFRTGEGVADFRSRDDMKRVIRELDDTKLNGRRVRLREDKQSSRSRSRSPRRSSKRSRSRSKDRARRSRSRENRGRDYRSRSRNRSRSRSKGKSADRRSRSKSPSDRRSKSPGDRKSGSPAPKKSRSRSPADKRSRSKSKSRSPEHNRSRSKSRSPAEKRSPDDRRSRSHEERRSRSPGSDNRSPDHDTSADVTHRDDYKDENIEAEEMEVQDSVADD